MAALPYWQLPATAHFCSLFRAAFSLPDFTIEELEEALTKKVVAVNEEVNGEDDDDDDNSFLNDLLVRLLSGCYQRRDITPENYEKYLRDFVKHRYAKEAGHENVLVEDDATFQTLSLCHKVEVLHCLCDARLDAPDVADVLKNLESDSLRVLPLGQDETGSTYWYFYGTRLYKEDPAPPVEEESKKSKRERSKRRKERERKRKRKEKKRKRGRGRKRQKRGNGSAAAAPSSSSESESDDEPLSKLKAAPPPKNLWSIVCSTEEEWVHLAERFKKSKSRCERALHRTIKEDFLPEIGQMIIEREKAQRRKVLEMAPRRTSRRIEKLRHKRAEEERVAMVTTVEEQKHIFKQLDERKQQLDQDDELHVDRQLMKEEPYTNLGGSVTPTSLRNGNPGWLSTAAERAKRAQLREERAQLLAQGKELPPHLHHSKRSNHVKGQEQFTETLEDLCTGLYKVFEDLKNHPNSWPFVRPVDERYAPDYYDVIERPMDLSTIEERLQSESYCTTDEFEEDVTLMLDNCRKYNGITSEYTKLGESLRTVLKKSMERHFPEESSEDEDEFVPEDGDDVKVVKTPAAAAAANLNVSASRNVTYSRPRRPASRKALEVISQALKDSSAVESSSSSRAVSASSSPDVARKLKILSTPKSTTAGQPMCVIKIPAAAMRDALQRFGTLGNAKQVVLAPGSKVVVANNNSTQQKTFYAPIRIGKQPETKTAGVLLPVANQQTNDKKTVLVSRPSNTTTTTTTRVIGALPDSQRRSMLNFTALYQASLLGKDGADKGGVKSEPQTLANKNAQTGVAQVTQKYVILQSAVPQASQQILVANVAATTTTMQTVAATTTAKCVSATAVNSSTVPTTATILPKSSIPVKKRAYYGVEDSATSSSVISAGPIKTEPVTSNDNSTQPEGERKWISVNGNGSGQQQVPPVQNSSDHKPGVEASQVELLNSQRKSVIASVSTSGGVNVKVLAEGLAGKLQSNGGGSEGYVQLPRGFSPAAENFVRTMNMAAISVAGGETANGSPTTTVVTSPRVVQQQQVSLVRPVTTTITTSAQVPCTTYTLTAPQPQPRYQYVVTDSSPTQQQRTTVLPVGQQRYVLASQPAYKSPPAAPAQIQYIDQSGVRYAAVGSNLVPLTIQREPQQQQQQIYYIQQQPQGQVMHLLTQPFTATHQNTVGTKTLVTVPTIPQQTATTAFLSATQQPAAAALTQNGTVQHYYTTLPRHSTS